MKKNSFLVFFRFCLHNAICKCGSLILFSKSFHAICVLKLLGYPIKLGKRHDLGENLDGISDKNGVFIYIIGLCGNIHHARYFARNLYAVHLFIYSILIKRFSAEEDQKNDKKLKKIVDALDNQDTWKRVQVLCKYSILHLDYVLKVNDAKSLINDYQLLKNIRKFLGDAWYKLASEQLPGWYRGQELALMPMFSTDRVIVKKWAEKLLTFENTIRKDAKTGLPGKSFEQILK